MESAPAVAAEMQEAVPVPIWKGLAAFLLLLNVLPVLPALCQDRSFLVLLLTANAATTALAIAAWAAKRRSTRVGAVRVSFKPAHLAQVFAQGAVYVAWAAFVPAVITRGPFILYQLVLAYVCQTILAALCDEDMKLGFSNFPIILSINFFFWTTPPFQFIQILLVPAAVAIKRFVVRKSGPFQAHVFNPSAVVMALVLYAVVIVGKPVTYNVSSTFTRIELGGIFIFAAGCLSQWVGGTMPIALGSVAFFAVIHALQPGFILDPAIFLGVTLLATDPITSPRTLIGQLVYGGVYFFFAGGTQHLFGLSRFMPLSVRGDYNKLLCLPFLNYLVPWFDRFWPRRLAVRTPDSARIRAAILVIYLLLFAFVWRDVHNPHLQADPGLYGPGTEYVLRAAWP